MPGAMLNKPKSATLSARACGLRFLTRIFKKATPIWYKLLPCSFVTLLWGQTNVLTANYGNERTNANLGETILTTANVNPALFGKLGEYKVDGQIYAQPLFVTGAAIVGQGIRNLVYVATMHNSVYAFDADSPGSTTPLWQVNLGPSLPTRVVHLRAINREIGILGTPVIDLGTNTIFLVAESYELGTPIFKLHALDLSDGSEKLGGPMVIQATADGSGDASQNGKITLDPFQHLQRPGLLLANNSIYTGFGSIDDRYPYHGWILAYDASTLNRTAVFNDTPEGGSGGVWQSGRGLGADESGNIYTVTGNGDYDGLVNFGESFVKLSPSLQVLDWFAPDDWRELSDVDYDLGSLGPVLVPGTNLLIGGDKASHLYLVDRENMGHLGIPDAPVPQIFQPISWGGLHNMALWSREPSPIAYFVEEGDWTGAFRITGGTMENSPFSQTSVTSDWPFQGMAISANGGAGGSGILWLTAGDHSLPAVPGTLYAFDALDLTNLLWMSEMKPKRDRMGRFAKFATPTVANGRVYVPTLSRSLTVYGLLPLQR
jgi:hypothetical protein